jgi:hypothetical protein
VRASNTYAATPADTCASGWFQGIVKADLVTVPQNSVSRSRAGFAASTLRGSGPLYSMSASFKSPSSAWRAIPGGKALGLRRGRLRARIVGSSGS